MQKRDAEIIAKALLELWQYAAEIQHKVPPEEAFRLLYQRLDERWVEADQRSNAD
jgi:hypothetical protein